MDIIVCVKRVPDVGEAELEIDRSGTGIRLDDLAFCINEWDNYAIEEAVRIKEGLGGKVTALTVGGPEDEEVLRRALAMGADEAFHLLDPAFEGSDPLGVATCLHAAIAKLPHDLVLTGAVSADGGTGHVGPMLAALLDLPHVVLATRIEIEGRTARVRHEVEDGLERVVEVPLPALVTVQTGINEPRYVSIRGIRKVAGIRIPTRSALDLDLDPARVGAAAARVRGGELALPTRGAQAEMLEGSDEEMVDGLLGKLRERGLV